MLLYCYPGKHAPPSGAAEAGTSATLMCNDGKRAPPCCSAVSASSAATMGVRYDGKRCSMSREQVAKRQSESKSGEQGGQLIVGGRDETLEGGNSGWRGHRGGRDDQATAKLCQALGHQRDHAVSKGRGRGSMIICRRDQRRLEPLEGFDGLERLQVDERKRKRGKQLEMLMHVVSSASGARRQCKESRLCQETLRYHNR